MNPTAGPRTGLRNFLLFVLVSVSNPDPSAALMGAHSCYSAHTGCCRVALNGLVRWLDQAGPGAGAATPRCLYLLAQAEKLAQKVSKGEQVVPESPLDNENNAQIGQARVWVDGMVVCGNAYFTAFNRWKRSLTLSALMACIPRRAKAERVSGAQSYYRLGSQRLNSIYKFAQILVSQPFKMIASN